MNVLVSLAGYVVFEGLPVLHGFLARPGDHHGLRCASELPCDGGAEVFDDDFDALLDVGLVQCHESCDLPLGVVGLAAWVFFDGLVQAIESVVGGVVRQHVQDEAFFDGLLHGVDIEGLPQALRRLGAKQLQGCGLGGGGEGEDGDVVLLTVLADLIREHVLNIHFTRITRSQGLGDSGHVFAGGGRVGLVDDNGKALVI